MSVLCLYVPSCEAVRCDSKMMRDSVKQCSGEDQVGVQLASVQSVCSGKTQQDSAVVRQVCQIP